VQDASAQKVRGLRIFQTFLQGGAVDETQLNLSAEERTLLIGFLASALKGVQVEEHRTRTPSYRTHVTHEKELIAGLLNKLDKSATQSGLAN
jgi:hypothetical protein